MKIKDDLGSNGDCSSDDGRSVSSACEDSFDVKGVGSTGETYFVIAEYSSYGCQDATDFRYQGAKTVGGITCFDYHKVACGDNGEVDIYTCSTADCGACENTPASFDAGICANSTVEGYSFKVGCMTASASVHVASFALLLSSLILNVVL